MTTWDYLADLTEQTLHLMTERGLFRKGRRQVLSMP